MFYFISRFFLFPWFLSFLCHSISPFGSLFQDEIWFIPSLFHCISGFFKFEPPPHCVTFASRKALMCFFVVGSSVHHLAPLCGCYALDWSWRLSPWRLSSVFKSLLRQQRTTLALLHILSLKIFIVLFFTPYSWIVHIFSRINS